MNRIDAARTEALIETLRSNPHALGEDDAVAIFRAPSAP